MSTKEKTGLIFNIQRHSTEDGPGIRTTVFLKGCSMRCPWCHNPEAIKATPELVWYASKCIGAAHCLGACPQKALTLTEEGIIINRNLCDTCGECVDVCPAEALELLGKRHTVSEVAQKVLREKIFYEKSGGGVTVSGGEPSLQAPFVMALMEEIRKAGVHVALDTCAGTKWDILGSVVQLADLILLDLKIMDRDAHLKALGVPQDLVLENARKIAELGKTIWVRTPVIPGYTDSVENIRKVAAFIKQNLPTVERYDILAFNNLCSSKYERLNRSWDLETADQITKDKMEILANTAKEQGLEGIVHWSGLTKLES